METIHRIYEHAPATITIPPELQDQPVAVTIKPLGASTPDASETKTPADPHIAQFFGCLPDLPTREPQGAYERRR